VTETLRFDGDALHLLDQRALPAQVRYEVCRTAEETANAIAALVVRGAPAIGVAAAFGMVLAAKRAAESGQTPDEALDTAHRVLAASRPTAVNLFWALDQIERVRASQRHQTVEALCRALEVEARRIMSDDIASCHAIGEFGADLVPARARILTHCNAGALATAGYGTALGVIRSAHRQGKVDRVFADETRPVLQGARLTTWELLNDNIPTTLITDSMAGFLMSRGEINCVVVGADRIARNGDIVNKIGTYTVAVLAREHGIPFLVAAPRSTFDLATATGADVTIEERDPMEVLTMGGVRTAPVGAEARNPAFDVTPEKFVTAIICEAGVATSPFRETLPRLMGLASDPDESATVVR
jgi:methylthioribose-1-phosphate isomerase